MKHLLFVLVTIAVIALGIAGIYFIAEAGSSSHSVTPEARTPNLVGGLTCLVLATGLLGFGVFALQKRDRDNE